MLDFKSLRSFRDFGQRSLRGMFLLSLRNYLACNADHEFGTVSLVQQKINKFIAKTNVQKANIALVLGLRCVWGEGCGGGGDQDLMVPLFCI